MNKLLVPNTSDIMTVISVLKTNYELVTPKILACIYGLPTDGKLLRGHLRKHFADISLHAHGDNWLWKTNSPALKAVIEYMNERFLVNTEYMKTLKQPTPKTSKTDKTDK
jgi:hypothetical protein